MGSNPTGRTKNKSIVKYQGSNQTNLVSFSTIYNLIFSEDTYRFMFAALQEAEKGLEENEVPVGAVVVKDNKIIGRGYNQVEKLKDATAHAEMIALTAAANHLANWRLNECSIYVTLEPCIMCTGALLASRINKIFFAAFDPKFGACGSVYNLAEDGKTNHKIKLYSGIYSDESKKLMQDFFLNLEGKKPLIFSPSKV